MAQFLSQLARQIGFGKLADRAGVCYQSVSAFAKDPGGRPNNSTKFKIVQAIITESTARKETLQKEISQIDETINQLAVWQQN